MTTATLRIRLLGGFELIHAGTPLPPFESARVESLLAYLVLQRSAPQLRQHLAFVLWPDSTEAQARTNLRHLLHKLRRALPDADRLLDITARTVQWRPDESFTLDVAGFEASLHAAEQATDDDAAAAALKSAVDQYTGDLLDGHYDEWLLEERERLRQRHLDALERLANLLAARGDPRQAIRYADELVRRQPLHEEAHRMLMRLHHACGDRAQGLRAYHQCVAALERELGVAPSAATTALYESLLPVTTEAPQRAEPPRVAGPPLVGRTDALAELVTLWRHAAQGQPHLAIVTGDPGIGKTRVVEELATVCAQRGAVVAVARCYRAEGALAYGPVVAWLRTDEIRDRLERLPAPYVRELARLIPELADDVSARDAEPLTDAEHRLRLFDAVASALRTVGAPALLVVDDIHWCDPDTLRLLHYLLRTDPPPAMLVAATARAHDLDAGHPLQLLVDGLRALDRCTQLALARLTRSETAVLAEHLAGAPYDRDDADRLFDQTEGNPLFIIEAVRAGWRPGRTPHAWESARVQAAIESRLAALSATARRLVDTAATIGREFTADVLTAASDLDEAQVVVGLDELWRRGIVREHGRNAYDFGHDKIRETAYSATSPALRRWQHRRVADAILARHTGDAEAVAGVLAVHYDAAGTTDEAVRWYERAAEAAQRVHAPAEAVRLLDRARALLSSLPESRERHERELAVLSALPAPLVALEGYLAPRVRELQKRALELANLLDVEPASPLLRSLAIGSLSADDFAAAEGFAAQLRDRGERTGDNVLLVEADYVLGVAAFWQAHLHDARRHLQAAVDGYRPAETRVHLVRYGQDPKIMCLMRLGYTQWFLGHADSAVHARDEALAMAEELGHPYTKLSTVAFAALLALEQRDHDALHHLVSAYTAEEVERSPQTQLMAEILTAYADVLAHPAGGGLARIRAALDGLTAGLPAAPGIRAAGQRVWLAGCVAADEPQDVLDAAGQLIAMHGAARPWASEAHRLRAWALDRMGGPVDAVDAALRRALDVAHGQGARTLELRAAVSLLHHQVQRRDPDASGTRDHLERLLDELPEPPAPADLAEAQDALNEERSRNARTRSSSA